MEKQTVAEVGHIDLLSVNGFSFAKMPVSQETCNRL